MSIGHNARCRVAPSLAALVLAVCVVCAASASARHRTHCQAPRGAHVQLRTGKLALWTARVRTRHGHTQQLFACLQRTGKRHVVAGATGPFRAAGVYFAYSSGAGFDREGVGTYILSTYNVARGTEHYYDVHFYNGRSEDFKVAAFAVSAKGFLAYQEVDRGTPLPDGPRPYGAITARDSRGIRTPDMRGVRTLDSAGPDDFSDLAIRGETVYWKKDGVPKSAKLG